VLSGAPELKSIEAISFGPDGLLLIGDGKGGQVVAVETGDTQTTSWAKKSIDNIKGELAGRLGTAPNNIEIIKLAVNPASQRAYIAVRQLSAKKDLILTVDGDGKISEFALDKVKYARIGLPEGEKSPVTRVTDITWAGDRVLVAAQANETFGSKIISMPAPLQHESTGTIFSTETYHVGHGQWETKAPLQALIPFEEDGEKFVVGSFTCTPIVKYPLKEIKAGAKVKGTSVIELGTGNTPQDMFSYTKNGKTYILMSAKRMAQMHKNNPVGPSPHWVAKVDANILKEMEKVNQKAIWRVKGKADKSLTEIALVVPEFHGVVAMDRINDQDALVIRTDDKGGFSLAVLPLP